MRKEQFEVNNYVHVYNRGNRKAEIVRATADGWRFMQALRFFNDYHSSTHILREISLAVSNTAKTVESVFDLGWPPDWPARDPLVKILCYCLMPNHFHLLLKETHPGGISKFMQKIGIGYTNFFNLKYHEVGRVFQGSYRARVIKEQKYLEYLCVYIQVLNVLELFPGGIETAVKNPQKAIEFVNNYNFSSHRDYAGLRNSLIIEKDVLGDIFLTPKTYQEFAYQSILAKDLSGMSDDLKLD